MSIRSTLLSPVLLGTALLWSVGCAERPTDRITAAERMVAEAKSGPAATYATEEVRRLEKELVALVAADSEQGSRMRLMRDYAQIDLLATSIAREAQRVIATAAREHEEARTLAAAALDEAQEAVEESGRLVAALRSKRKLGTIRRQANDSEALTHSMQTARQAMVEGDFVAAEARARAIAVQASLVSGQIQSIAARLGESVGTRLAQNDIP